MKSFTYGAIGDQARDTLSAFFMAIVFVGMLALPEIASAQPSDAEGRVKSFFDNINDLLDVASIAVVTIAVIFAGYQIAFAHKRMADVAPVLIGGFLIGAAAQIAQMLLPDSPGTPGGMATLLNTLPKLYA